VCAKNLKYTKSQKSPKKIPKISEYSKNPKKMIKNPTNLETKS
jgi:hypothetical protein